MSDMTPQPEILQIDFDVTKAWYKANAAVGLRVPVLHGAASMNWFEGDIITGINPKAGRLYVHLHSAFYMSGKNAFHPKGQTVLMIPTPDRLAACGAKLHWNFNQPDASWGPGRRHSFEDVEAMAKAGAMTGESR